MTPVIIDRRCEQFYTVTLEHYAYLCASTVDKLCASAADERWHLYMQSKEQYSSITLSQFRSSDPMFYLQLNYWRFETMVMKKHLADVVQKTAYFSLSRSELERQN
jgi:hypothetical protein